MSTTLIAHTITLVVSTREVRPTEVTVPVHIGAGMRVTGMVVQIATNWTDAHFTAASRGKEVFDAVVRHGNDPALLEATDDGLVLHVFPLVANVDARVTLTVEPDASADDWMTDDPLAVGPKVSLYAGPTLRRNRDVHLPRPNILRVELARQVARHHDELAHCGTVDGNLEVDVSEDGEVTSTRVTGALTHARPCIEAAVASWRFGAGDRRTLAVDVDLDR